MSENGPGEFVRGFLISLHPFSFQFSLEMKHPVVAYQKNNSSLTITSNPSLKCLFFVKKMQQDVNFKSSQSQENPSTPQEAALSTGVVKSIICTELPVIPTSLPLSPPCTSRQSTFDRFQTSLFWMTDEFPVILLLFVHQFLGFFY